MFLKHLDLTTALRPSYLPDEVLLFVQDNVGLYEGCALVFLFQRIFLYILTHTIGNSSFLTNRTAKCT